MKRATIERKTRSIDCFLHRCLIARHRALSAKLPTLIVKTWHSSVRMVCVWLLVWLSEFGVLLNCCILSSQLKLIRARNTSRHAQPLISATHKIRRRVTTHVDDIVWCGGWARTRIHSWYHTMYHVLQHERWWTMHKQTRDSTAYCTISLNRWVDQQDFTLTNLQSLEFLVFFRFH